jgi:hypothetical protein
LLALTSVASAAEDRVYTQEEKVWLLKDAYKRIYGTLPEGPQVTFKVPDPEPPEDAVWPKVEKPKKVMDVCARHNMRKVVRGKTWRCRK